MCSMKSSCRLRSEMKIKVELKETIVWHLCSEEMPPREGQYLVLRYSHYKVHVKDYEVAFDVFKKRASWLGKKYWEVVAWAEEPDAVLPKLVIALEKVR